jgi:hypothetical protein
MTIPSHPSGSALRERMIEDMNVRGFTGGRRHLPSPWRHLARGACLSSQPRPGWA